MINKTILVTGHAGFIGSHLTRKLLDLGYSVVGVDEYNDYYNVELKKARVEEFRQAKNFREYVLDIRDKKMKLVFEDQKIDIVVHLAARAGVRPSLIDPRLYMSVNVDGTANLLELSKQFQVKKFVFGSSSSVYGNQEKTPFSETDRTDFPVSPYAASKKAAEMLCYTYHHLHEMDVTCLRFFTVYGPSGRPDMSPLIFTHKLISGEKIIRFGNGDDSRRDYTYIDDIVAGIVKAMETKIGYEIINLGNNKPVSLNRFIEILEKITGKKAQIVEQPRNPADVDQTYADIAKAKKLLSWQPKIDLEAGLKKTVEWYKLNKRFW